MKKAYTILAITAVIFMTGYYAKETGDAAENHPETWEKGMQRISKELHNLKPDNEGNNKGNRLLNIYEEPIGMVVGGPTQFRAVENSDLHIWNSVLIKSQPEYNNVNLRKLGDPVAVSTQVVAGVNYVFKFSDDTVIKVWRKLGNNALEDRLELSEVNNVKAFETFVGNQTGYNTKEPEDVEENPKKETNANNQKIITSLIEEYRKGDTNRLLQL